MDKKNPKRKTYNANSPNGLCHLGSILYALGKLEDSEIRSIPGEYFKEDIEIKEKKIIFKHRILNVDLKAIKLIEKGTSRKVIIGNFPDIWKKKNIF